MATTPVYALPYPIGTDRVMDGDNAIQALAERVEALLGPSLAVPSGFRNVIRNGDFGIAQRGNGPFTAHNGWMMDGWRLATVGSGGTTGTRERNSLGAANGSRFLAQVVAAGTAAAADQVVLFQAIEYAETLAGRQVTLSFWAKASGGAPKLGIEIEQYFGAGGSPSATVQTAVGAVTISTTLTRYSVTFTMPSVSGKTMGTNETDNASVRFWVLAGTDYASRASNIGIQNFTLQLADVQLEAGPTATPFERLPQQQQLAWCQRYFQRIGDKVPNDPIGNGLVITASVAQVIVAFAQEMRAAATVTYTAASTFAVNDSGMSGACTAIANDLVSTRSVNISATLAGLTAGRGARLLRAGGAVCAIDISAEL